MYTLNIDGKKDYLSTFYVHNFDTTSPYYKWSNYITFNFKLTKIPIYGFKFQTKEAAEDAIKKHRTVIDNFLVKSSEHVKFLENLLTQDVGQRVITLKNTYNFTTAGCEDNQIKSWIAHCRDVIAESTRFASFTFKPYSISVDEMLRFDKRQQTASISHRNDTPFTRNCNCCGVLIPFKTSFSIRGYIICPLCMKTFADKATDEINTVISENKEYVERYTAERFIQLL